MKIAEEYRKVLVVDDDPNVRRTVTLCLQDAYQITSVESGERALEVCQEEDFSVVVLDLRMEGISGIETLKKLKAQGVSPSVIILTAYSSKETAISAVNLGAFNYLTKPFDQKHLKSVVAEGCAAYSKRNHREQEMRAGLEQIHNTFFSILCHEFNTPLNAIMGFSELLAESVQEPEQASWAQTVHTSGAHLHDILMEMIDYVSASYFATEDVEADFVPSILLEPLLEYFEKKNIQLEIMHENDSLVRGPSKAILVLARQLTKIVARQSPEVHINFKILALDTVEPELRFTVRGGASPSRKKSSNDALAALPLWQALGGEAHGVDFDLEIAALEKVADYANGILEHHRTLKGAVHFLVRIPLKLVVDLS